jgi:hypothetical protein
MAETTSCTPFSRSNTASTPEAAAIGEHRRARAFLRRIHRRIGEIGARPGRAQQQYQRRCAGQQCFHSSSLFTS